MWLALAVSADAVDRERSAVHAARAEASGVSVWPPPWVLEHEAELLSASAARLGRLAVLVHPGMVRVADLPA